MNKVSLAVVTAVSLFQLSVAQASECRSTVPVADMDLEAAIAAQAIGLDLTDPTGKENPLQKIERTRNTIALLTCARDFIEERRGGLESVDLAAHYIGLLEKYGQDGAKLKELSVTCRKTKDELESSGAFSLTRDEQLARLKELTADLSPKTFTITHGFIRPRVSCSKGGLNAAVGAWILAAGARVSGSYCVSTTGRSWVELGVGLSWNPSEVAVVEADVFWGKAVRLQNNHARPIDLSAHMAYTGGLLLVGRAETDGLDVKDAEYPRGRDLRAYEKDLDGIGFGLATTTEFGTEANIKVIPMGTDDEVLLGLLKK